MRPEKPRALPGRFERRVGATFAALAALAFAPAAQAQSAIKVGIVNSLNGPAASAFGNAGNEAAKLMVEAINSGTLPAPYNKMGLAGAKIDPIYVDETGPVSNQVQDFRNLVTRDGAQAVIGYISSGSCLAIAPVAEELKILTIFYDCATPRIFEQASYRYVFRTTGTATADVVAAARYTAEMMPKLTTYGGVNQNYAWGQDAWRDYQLAMKTLMPAAKLTVSLMPQLFSGQYGGEISKLSIDRPQAVMSSLWGGDLESFILQAVGRGLNRQTQLIMTAAETTVFTLREKLPAGTFIGGRGGSEGVFVPDTPLSRWFRTEYKKRFGADPTSPAYLMARSFLLLKLGYEKVGAPNAATDQLITAMEGMEFDAFGQKVSMALGKGHQAVSDVSFATYAWNAAKNEPEFTNVRVFPMACVTPPEGTESQTWLEKGMPGAKCP